MIDNLHLSLSKPRAVRTKLKSDNQSTQRDISDPFIEHPPFVLRTSQNYRFGTVNAVPEVSTTSPGGTTTRTVSASSTHNQERYYASLNMGGNPIGGSTGRGWLLIDG